MCCTIRGYKVIIQSDDIGRKFAIEAALEVIGVLDIARGKEFVIPVPSQGILQRNG